MSILILRLFNWGNGKIRLSTHLRDRLICLTGFGTLLLVMIPYVVGDVPTLYQFFHQQPKDIMIAS
ncbi:MAG: hypothetical protein PUP93_23285 [Rhizonema sp. NSF051]|nr:hypothetical protein [Rhizonema sp. NSF051]